MKHVVLIHGFNGIPKMYEWLRDQLAVDGVEVILPSFPPQEGVVYEKWAAILDDYADAINEDAIVVCHSIGNEFLIKYLCEKQLKAGAYIGLAGFADVFYREDKELLNRAVEKFLASQEEKDYFVAATQKRYAIFSDDDHLIPREILEQYPREIQAESILIPGIGHMGKKSGLEEFPALLDLVKENL